MKSRRCFHFFSVALFKLQNYNKRLYDWWTVMLHSTLSMALLIVPWKETIFTLNIMGYHAENYYIQWQLMNSSLNCRSLYLVSIFPMDLFWCEIYGISSNSYINYNTMILFSDEQEFRTDSSRQNPGMLTTIHISSWPTSWWK